MKCLILVCGILLGSGSFSSASVNLETSSAVYRCNPILNSSMFTMIDVKSHRIWLDIKGHLVESMSTKMTSLKQKDGLHIDAVFCGSECMQFNYELVFRNETDAILTYLEPYNVPTPCRLQPK